MLKSPMILGTLLLVGLFLYLAAFSMTHSYVYRYKLTVQIDTPSGIKSGSSIFEVRTTEEPEWISFDQNPYSITYRGEAIPIFLGNGKTILMLLHGEFSWMAPVIYLGAARDQASMNKAEAAKNLVNMTGEEREIPGELLPSLIYFENISDPMSVHVLYETDANANEVIIDNFRYFLGEGYSFRKMTIELTDEEPHYELKERLPWWDDDGNTQVKIWQQLKTKKLSGSFSGITLFIKN